MTLPSSGPVHWIPARRVVYQFPAEWARGKRLLFDDKRHDAESTRSPESSFIDAYVSVHDRLRLGVLSPQRYSKAPTCDCPGKGYIAIQRLKHFDANTVRRACARLQGATMRRSMLVLLFLLS